MGSLVLSLFLIVQLHAQTCADHTATATNLQDLTDVERQIDVQLQNATAGQISSASCRGTLLRRGKTIELRTFPVVVKIGDKITCKGPGTLAVDFRNQTHMELLPNSSLTVDDYVGRDKSSPSQLVLGQIWGVIKGVVGAIHEPQKVTVVTPVANIDLPGTKFLLRRRQKNAADEVTLRALEGDGWMTSRRTDQTLMLKAGEQATATEKGLRVPILPAPAK